MGNEYLASAGIEAGHQLGRHIGDQSFFDDRLRIARHRVAVERHALADQLCALHLRHFEKNEMLRNQAVKNRPRLTGIEAPTIGDTIDQTPVPRGWASDSEEDATLILVEMLPHETRGNRIAHGAFEFL